MKPLLPSEIKILNHIYKVIEVDEIVDSSVHSEEGEQILGLLDDKSLQILLVKSLHPSRKYQIFLHELVHAIFNIIDFQRLLKDPDSEETVVNFVSDALLQILTDNPLKFPRRYLKMSLTQDKNLADNIMSNHDNGVSIPELSKSFQVAEKEVKQLINSRKDKKKHRTKKKLKKK